MAVPKRRSSKTRGRTRRAQWRTAAPNLSRCAQCNSIKRAHHVCPKCGYYGGRQAVAVADEN